MSDPLAPTLNLIFAGTPDFAATHLEALLDSGRHRVVAVYTQPDRPAGHSKKLQPSPVKQIALEHDLPVLQPVSLKDAGEQARLRDFNADLMVVVAYGLLLPLAVLETPRLGCINVHASLLPRWRGAAPIQRAIEAGDRETGITIMQMDEGLDTGDMLLKVTCPVEATETGGSLHDRLAALGPDALIDALDRIAGGTAQAEAQDDALATYAAKIHKDEAQIDWQQPADVIERRIRAFHPVPVCWTTVGDERLRIWRAVADTQASPLPPGSVVDASAEGIRVTTGSTDLLLTEIQLPGKNRMPTAEVLKSRAALFARGTRFGS